jgi:hypothetical protein
MAEATQAQIRAAALIERLLADSSVGAKVRSEAKAMFEDVSFPEDRLEPLTAPLAAENAALRERLDKMEADRAAERVAAEESAAQRTFENRVAEAKSKYALSAEGVEAVLNRMKETGNYTDVDATAAWFVQANPPAKAPKNAYGSGTINIFEGGDADEYKELMRNPDQFLDAQLNKFANDPDHYVAEAFGQ